MSNEERKRLVEQFGEQLGEHFDAVQILVSFNEDAETTLIKHGAGNWYARQGIAHAFINSDVAQDAAEQLARRLDRGDK
jgi:hypothetical protein